jgi:hypothetical protein
MIGTMNPVVHVTFALNSMVGTATCYGLDGQEIESRWGASLSSPVQNCPEAHPASYAMGTRFFPGVKAARVDFDIHHELESWVKKV